MNFLAHIVSLITNTIQLILSPFQLLGTIRFPPWVRAFLEVFLVIGVVGGLGIVNYTMGLDRYLEPGPGAPKWLGKVWLGVIALLVYVAIRLLIFIIQQLPGTQAQFPDIDEAFDAGLEALAESRINLRDAPLFITIGMPSDAEEAFATSSLVSKDVRVSAKNLPIHWYGNEKGIWVTLPGVSALTQQVQMSVKPGAGPKAPAGNQFGGTLGGDGGGGGGGNRFSTMGGGNRFSTLGAAGDPVAEAAPAQEEANEGYRASRRLTLEDKEFAELRIEYFVKRLREARYPVCPLNGVLVVFPYEWTSSPGLSQLADTAKVDMTTMQNKLGTKCLCVGLLSGIERSPEFVEYVNRMDKGQLERRCGCSFPSFINPEPADFEKAHTWLIQYFERQVFDLYNRKLGDPGNGQLFRLLEHLRKSKANFVRLFNNAFPREVDEPFYIGGVYFAGIGRVGAADLPFFQGVLAKLHGEHDEVIGWNDQALTEDTRYQYWSKFVMIGAVIMVILAALLILSIVLKW